MTDFYEAGWTGEVPVDLFALDDHRKNWELESEENGLWVACSPLVQPHAFEAIARLLDLKTEDVIAISEGVAKWDAGVVYLEPIPSVRLSSTVDRWNYDRQLWAIVTAHDESLPDDVRRAAAEVLKNGDWGAPAFTSEPDSTTGPVAILHALEQRDLPVTGIVHAFFIPPISMRPRLSRIGGMSVENPVTRLFRKLILNVRYGEPHDAQQILHHVFESYGWNLVRAEFWDSQILEHDEEEETDEGNFGDQPYSERYEQSRPTEVEGLALVGDLFAVDFPFVTFLTTRQGEVLAQWPSFGAKLIAAFDEKTLTYSGPGWELVQFDIESKTWRRTLCELPRFAFVEGMEQAFVMDRETNFMVRMAVPDYPVYFTSSPCGSYVGAVTNEALGGVYRYDGEEQFEITQFSFHDAPVLNLRTGEVGANEAESWDDIRFETVSFAFVLVQENEQVRWQVANGEGYLIGLDPMVAFYPSPSAMAFSSEGSQLLVAGDGLSLLACSENGVALKQFFKWNDLGSLGPDVDGKKDEALQIALSTYGTLDRFGSTEGLKKLVIPVDYATNRNSSHKETKALVELSKNRTAIKQLFTKS